MCGITALFEPTAPSWLGATVEAMTQLVRHRGPDGEGFAFFNGDGVPTTVISDDTPARIEGARAAPAGGVLGFGHRRLSIVDLTTAGHQPMSDAAGDAWITFNGEIYNYLEVRAELATLGHTFRTASDTEVILAAWREWGDACLARFNGMFAFVLFDRRRRHVFVARDRFGVKPLYLWRTPTGGIAFASEIKQFTAHPQWRARLNGQRVYDYLNWGVTDHTAETMFADVTQLRGGECISAPLVSLATAQPRRWYELRPRPFAGDLAAAGEQFRALFDDSVRLRLRADVPVGSCLSGGLDSSSIVCTVRAQLGEQAPALQKTFSAYSDVARFDERSFIEETATATGAQAHHVTPDPSGLFDELSKIAWHQDEPFSSTSIYAQWCVFRLARANGVIVMLDGQGADEALAGYHGYFDRRIAGLLRRGRFMEGWRDAAAIRQLHGQSMSLQLMQLADQLLPAGVANPMRRLAGRTVNAPYFLDLAKLGAEPISPRTPAFDNGDPVRALSYAELTALNLPMLLRYEDRDSMAHSVEARLPFLDYRLVEFCLGLPEEHKISQGWTKRALREAMRGRLPERVRLRRDKIGFATAEEVWMRDQRRDAFLRLLQDSLEAARGWLTPAAEAKARRIVEGQERFSFQVWRFISFGQWLKTFSIQAAA